MPSSKRSVEVINKGGGPAGFVLFVAWFGALVYFVQNSVGFGGFIMGVLQSFVWPALVLYRVLQILKI
jgi:hypothetical protein